MTAQEMEQMLNDAYRASEFFDASQPRVAANQSAFRSMAIAGAEMFLGVWMKAHHQLVEECKGWIVTIDIHGPMPVFRVNSDTRTPRDVRQERVLRWVGATFGPATLTPEERVLRLLEEAIELTQAEGLTIDQIMSVARHVYGKPAGDPRQEVGGVGVTLLAYCGVKSISADAEESREVARVLSIEPAHFRERHNVKADAGIAARATEDSDFELRRASEPDQMIVSKRRSP